MDVTSSEHSPPRWDARAEAVSFVLPGATPVVCAIDRPALALLAGADTLGPRACLKTYRRHRAWIVKLARITLAERGAGSRDLKLSKADVAFQIACESVELSHIHCV